MHHRDDDVLSPLEERLRSSGFDLRHKAVFVATLERPIDADCVERPRTACRMLVFG